MAVQLALKELLQQLISLVLSSGAGYFVLPILTLLFLIRFFRWIAVNARGGSDLDDLTERAGEYRSRLERVPGRVSRAFKKRP